MGLQLNSFFPEFRCIPIFGLFRRVLLLFFGFSAPQKAGRRQMKNQVNYGISSGENS
jgi:hypothetical protein